MSSAWIRGDIAVAERISVVGEDFLAVSFHVAGSSLARKERKKKKEEEKDGFLDIRY
jgi:hypothetical protein